MFQQRLGDPRNTMKRWELELTFVFSKHAVKSTCRPETKTETKDVSPPCSLCLRRSCRPRSRTHPSTLRSAVTSQSSPSARCISSQAHWRALATALCKLVSANNTFSPPRVGKVWSRRRERPQLTHYPTRYSDYPLAEGCRETALNPIKII